MQTAILSVAKEPRIFDAFAVSPHYLVLAAILLIAATVDLREHRIPNWLVASGMVIGILFHGFSAQGHGTVYALSGLGVGIATLFPLYALGVMGAGDAKLMGTVGAFLGTSGVLGAVLATMVAGGVLALGMAAYKRTLSQLFANLHAMLVQRHIKQMTGSVAGAMPATPSVGKMPYAMAICTGTFVQIFLLLH